jgi:hypothetical protein
MGDNDEPVEVDMQPRVGQGGGVAGRCGWFRHDWDEGDDTCGTGCCTSTTRYTCRTCGKVKDRNNGMG